MASSPAESNQCGLHQRPGVVLGQMWHKHSTVIPRAVQSKPTLSKAEGSALPTCLEEEEEGGDEGAVRVDEILFEALDC